MISVILPIYNEVDNIRPLLAEIAEALAAHAYEIIAIDDGSRDGSTALLKELAATTPRLRVLFFRRNSGQSAAFDAGFRNASGDVIITMDADLQNDPRDIPKLVAKLDEGFDVVTGWRKNRKDKLFLRKIPSFIANRLIRLATGTRVHDLGCSLKAYRRAITEELRLYGEMHRFISVTVASLGAEVGEVEVNHRPRIAGKSKYGIQRALKVVLDLITVVFLRSYQTKPIYVFGSFGLGALSASFVVSAYVLWEKFDRDVWVHRNPLFLIAIVCLMMGVQFIAVGLLAEMITRTYFESQHKTPYTITSRSGFGDK